MKLYRDYQFASMSMVDDPLLVEAIPSSRVMIESGTYKGTGSTLMLAAKKPEILITIEANEVFYKEAVENLKPYSFIKPIFGLSVWLSEALQFIRSFDFEGDFFIDSEDPVAFYSKEINKPGIPQNLLRTQLYQYKNDNPVILLDSAGGIGFLEYSVVRSIMGNKPHSLVLDDTHHVKHYRSKQEAMKIYTLLYENKEHGSCVFQM